MAAFAPIPCVSQTGKTETLCLAWSSDTSAPLLAVSGKGSAIKVFNDDGDQQEAFDAVKRPSDAVIIAWHPKNKVLAMGWRDGAISVCSEPGRVPQEDTLVHTSTITLLTWSPDGSRLLTGDANGMMGIWKVDKRGRLTPICQYAKQGAITAIAFKNPEARPNSCPDFFFGGKEGKVCFATDSGKCTDAFSVGGDIASILTSSYNGSENVVVITRSFMLVQYQVPTNYPNSSLQQTLRVKMSGSANSAASLQCLWAGDGTLATVCNESMVRVWDLQRDENYMLSLHDAGIQRKSQSDVITKMVYHKQRGMLAAATKDGLVVFWRYVGASASDEDGSSAWAVMTSVALDARVDHLVWGPRPGLLGAGFADSASVLLESTLCRAVREGVGCIQNGPEKISISKTAGGTSLQITAGVRIGGADHDGQHLIVWNGKKAEVYDVGGEGGRFVAAFQKNAACMAIKGDSVYVVAGSRVEVCNLQGTIKHTIGFTDAEGEPTTLDIMGNYL
eukprot:SAG22_NODE_316_length_12517_cov_75.265180_1_plen_503_part_10